MSLPNESLTLNETLRIMDIASSLRKHREMAERELDLDQTKHELRQQLARTAAMTGEQVSEAEIEAALAFYFDTLHAYEDPPWSFAVLLAHLYIRRWLLFGVALLILVPTVVAVGLQLGWFS